MWCFTRWLNGQKREEIMSFFLLFFRSRYKSQVLQCRTQNCSMSIKVNLKVILHGLSNGSNTGKIRLFWLSLLLHAHRGDRTERNEEKLCLHFINLMFELSVPSRFYIITNTTVALMQASRCHTVDCSYRAEQRCATIHLLYKQEASHTCSTVL